MSMHWRKTHYPCHICDKKATGCYRPDLDIKGLCFCDEHKEQVQTAYLLIIQGQEEEAKKVLGKTFIKDKK